METKLYYAYVTADMVDYFEDELQRRDGVKTVNQEIAFSETGELLHRYVIEAVDGVIDPKWELK